MKYNKTRKISPKYKQYLVLFFLLFICVSKNLGIAIPTRVQLTLSSEFCVGPG